jgi:hypothetical protein
MQTKIRLDIPTSLVPNAEDIQVVIYDNVPKSISKTNVTASQGDRLQSLFIAEFPIERAERFNVWVRSGDKWNIVLGGVPQINILGTGEEILELNDRPQSDTVINKTRQITRVDADFANGVLGGRVVSPTEPTLAQKAMSLGSSMSDWAKAGFSMASTETLESRLTICKGCEFWDAAGFGGTGRCSKCGCSTQAKLRIATSACPLDPPKWGAQ